MTQPALEIRAVRGLSRGECEDFLIHEARLLDDARFDEWLALFTDKAHYWVPSEPNQQSPLDTVSLMYDDRRLLETRVRRLASPRIYSQEPRSRTSRIVTNVTVEGANAGETLVRSKFTIVEYRREEQRLFAGTYFHTLVGDRRRHPHRLQARRPRQLRRADGRAGGAVLARCRPRESGNPVTTALEYGPPLSRGRLKPYGNIGFSGR